MGNKNLNKARSRKNDEFYTQIGDIERELIRYKDQFKGKKVLCNCSDDPKLGGIREGDLVNPEGSNFWNFYYLQFENFGLDQLVAVTYNPGGRAKAYRYDGKTVEVEELEGDGDFRSPEGVRLIRETDVVCTNPPFSLFREFISEIMDNEVEFIVVGNFNAVSYKDIFPIIKDDRMWLGYSPRGMEFVTDTGELKSVNAVWYTNLEVQKRHEDMILYKNYHGNEEEYPTYDNYDAIEVNRVDKIPCDYDGIMGVPITFLTRYNPEQFEIIGSRRWSKSQELLDVYTGDCEPPESDKRTLIGGKETYDRIFIKHKRTLDSNGG